MKEDEDKIPKVKGRPVRLLQEILALVEKRWLFVTYNVKAEPFCFSDLHHRGLLIKPDSKSSQLLCSKLASNIERSTIRTLLTIFQIYLLVQRALYVFLRAGLVSFNYFLSFLTILCLISVSWHENVYTVLCRVSYGAKANKTKLSIKV